VCFREGEKERKKEKRYRVNEMHYVQNSWNRIDSVDNVLCCDSQDLLKLFTCGMKDTSVIIELNTNLKHTCSLDCSRKNTIET